MTDPIAHAQRTAIASVNMERVVACVRKVQFAIVDGRWNRLYKLQCQRRSIRYEST